MQTVLYDRIGKTYDQTRQADPQIVGRILQHLSPKPDGCYLDIGCGSGNYTHALFEKGINILGIDISKKMLAKAKRKNSAINWIEGDAKSLPFQSSIFDGAICTLATHHIQDIDRAFQEVSRVLSKGKFVLFTAFPEQMDTYWLKEYFPHMLRKATQKMAGFERLSHALLQAGFKHITMDRFYVSNDLKDWFLHAGKYRPEIYLDPQVRSGISTFAIEENFEEISLGCQRLKEDIHSGKIEQVIKSYESNLGDYAFVVCEK